MSGRNSDDWLPTGWTVKEKVRKNGKKDKYFFDSSGVRRFNSRVEVFRHLKTAGIIHSKHETSGGSMNQSEDDVAIEKSVAEELPPGWTKEVRVKKKGNKIMRRDAYYTDPVSGYVFRSMKDAHRYLKSGKIGRLAYKPKDKENTDVELEAYNISSLAAAKKEMISVSKAKRQIVWDKKSADGNEIVKKEEFDKPTSSGNCMVATEQSSDPISSDMNELVKNITRPTTTANQTSDPDRDPMHKPPVRKSRKNKELNMPRRASKRLAGSKVDPEPEVGASDRAYRIADMDKQVANSTETSGSWAYKGSQCPERLEAKQVKKSGIQSTASPNVPLDTSKRKNCGNFVTPVEHLKKVKAENIDHEKRQDVPVLPQENRDSMEEHVRTENKADNKPGSLLESPLEELLTDPCIAFAIKTLTATTFDISNSSEALPGFDDVNRPSGYLTDVKENSGVGNVETNGDKDDDKSCSMEKPFEELWSDPCIEFAIKMLTGEIPLTYKPENEDCFQKQASSSRNQGSSGSSESTVKTEDLNHLCQTVLEKPVFKHHSVMEPRPCIRNVSFQSSVGTGVFQHGGNRSNEFQR